MSLLTNLLLKRLFNAISEEDLFRLDRDKKTGRIIVFFRDKQLNEEQIQRLKESAQLFVNSDLWRMLKREVEYEANKRMYHYGLGEEAKIAGKMALYNLEVIDQRVKEIAQWQ